MGTVLSDLKAAAGRQKVVDASVLNGLGLQVARTLAARALHHVRRRDVDEAVAGWVRSVDRQGYVLIEDFLGPADFDAVLHAATAVLDSPAPRLRKPHGSNHVTSVWRSDISPEQRTVLDTFFLDTRLHALARALERRDQDPGAGRCLLQHVEQHDGAPDRESQAHSDTFFSTHKAWLYLTDVGEREGPLFFHPGSHRLGPRLLAGVYRESVGEARGSRRIDDRELQRRGIPASVLTCRRNTLVVANTFGYHGRLQGSPPAQRLSLHVEYRSEPFRRRSGRLRADTSSALDGPGA